MDRFNLLFVGAGLGLGAALALSWVLTAGIRRWAEYTESLRQRAETLLGHLPTAMVALDTTGRVAASNAAAEELWGCRLARGMDWAFLQQGAPWLTSEGTPAAPGLDPLLQALATGGAAEGMGFIQRAGSQRVPCLVRVVPLDGRRHDLRGVVATFERLPDPARHSPGGHVTRLFPLPNHAKKPS
ncbi:MAG: PAS domain-containing protein [Firmicutes bacterium]|nr:PAS domain-containing protein [Bacillota bacterium]